MFKKIALILVISSLILTGCANSAKSKPADDKGEKNAQEYVDSKNNFNVSYPETWEVVDKKDDAVAVMFMVKMADDLEDKFNENVNLIIENSKVKELKLDQYAENNKKNILASITDAEIVEERDLQINDMPAKMLIFNGTYNEVTLKWSQTYLVNDNKGYIFTFTDSTKDFDNHFASYQGILDSFTFKK